MEIIGDYEFGYGDFELFVEDNPFEVRRRISKLFVKDREDVIKVGGAITVGDRIPYPEVKPKAKNVEQTVDSTFFKIIRSREYSINIFVSPNASQLFFPLEISPYIFSARGCQTIAFKVPNIEIVEAYRQMDWVNKKYKNQVFFKGPNAGALIQPQLPSPFHAQIHGMD